MKDPALSFSVWTIQYEHIVRPDRFNSRARLAIIHIVRKFCSNELTIRAFRVPDAAAVIVNVNAVYPIKECTAVVRNINNHRTCWYVREGLRYKPLLVAI